jgi:hypothetical protein
MKRLRIAVALTGFLIAALSVALDDHWLGWLAICLLALSLALRLLKHKATTRGEADPPL